MPVKPLNDFRLVNLVNVISQFVQIFEAEPLKDTPRIQGISLINQSKIIMSDCKNHTDSPSGYIAWHEWAKRMSRTHRQIKCRGCGLYKIWIPRKKRKFVK